jgi:hypothetical protein
MQRLASNARAHSGDDVLRGEVVVVIAVLGSLLSHAHGEQGEHGLGHGVCAERVDAYCAAPSRATAST